MTTVCSTVRCNYQVLFKLDYVLFVAVSNLVVTKIIGYKFVFVNMQITYKASTIQHKEKMQCFVFCSCHIMSPLISFRLYCLLLENVTFSISIFPENIKESNSEPRTFIFFIILQS